ncbi:polysaccharide biosynthesis/export family protein [Aestuariibacter sp. A3R04]|uniref:polysaccharide biosynthesis/export family protein n=1 Tax=Aestuariibacter sp. A3R04 TaxID=2841571 RepID=UPI001C085D74|nr:polysaccharide biosynthesis/export family protein [Aestuariibacter sp. A3R04]MBU3022094.1 polysaccharide export protein [Aestuariibacter sp. A3R04]
MFCNRLTTTLALSFSLTVTFFAANAQSLSDLQQLREQSQQQNTGGAIMGSISSPSVSPMNVQTSRTLPGARNTGQASVGQYISEPRSGITLPGEPTIEDVFPMDEALSNPPFAANLFIGGFESERSAGLNDNYLIAPGDKISIWMWGAISYSDVVTVDNQGNVFIPNIGPIRVANTPAGSVNQLVANRIKQVYTNDVNIYVNLLTATPVSVYITGPVIRPGQYAGLASDSVLYYLKRAGGIDFKRGSFRKIEIKRNHQAVTTVDLYDFIRHGTLPALSFQDGDTIVVHPVGNRVTVTEGASNSYTFEFKDDELRGETLLEYARPQEFISHVSVAGLRQGEQFAEYLALPFFNDMTLKAGDQVSFVNDHPPMVYQINIAGQHNGPSQIMVDKGTRLKDVMDYVQIDETLSDPDNVFLLRESVAEKQRELIEQSLQRLERSIYTAPISSTGEGSIRVQEAQLVSDFIQRARQIEPQGKVIVAEKGEIANVLLEPNDTIVIPEVSDLIHVGGEVMMPQAIVYNDEATTADYVAWAGGFTQRADDNRILIIRKNGIVEFDSIHRSFWADGEGKLDLHPGDHVVVLPSIDVKSLQAIKDITQIIYQIAVAANVAID